MIRLAEPQIGAAEIEAVAAVLRSGFLVQGEKVAAFEQALAAYLGVRRVVAVSSGTAALHLSLLTLGIGPGDAVLVPAFTFPATANVVEVTGARSVLVDVDPATYCLTPEGLEASLRGWRGPEMLRAVIPVHEFGAPCDMEGICELAGCEGLAVIEDAACGLGARRGGRHVGGFGEAGCFSWHPRKAITTGEGGAVAVEDPELERRLVSLRSHGMERGSDGGTDFVLPGLNYRMTDFQAALGSLQLEKFDGWLAARAELAAKYRASLRECAGLRLPAPVPGHAWQTFMVVLPEGASRSRVMEILRGRGIETNLGAQALHRLGYFRDRYGYGREDYPVAAELFERGLALPLHPGVTPGQAGQVAQALGEALRE